MFVLVQLFSDKKVGIAGLSFIFIFISITTAPRDEVERGQINFIFIKTQLPYV